MHVDRRKSDIDVIEHVALGLRCSQLLTLNKNGHERFRRTR